ncbi:LytR/AlgR family response regulator transcription factor [Flavobacterium chuncheonense]|uniref:LytR/AlgR family response regulator transcription factor n=1 Tax=Flavobacterium chuncheonense TaxID=2026653 RepID=A0ABW5YR83_9FLAO
MNIIIIEDEKPAARLLQRKVEKLGYNLNKMLHTVEEAISWLANNPHPDLIFLDIQLSDGLSFEIFESIEIHSAVIFTTAYDEYALKAFKLNSIDYLLKPIDDNELLTAIEKFKTRTQVTISGFDFEAVKRMIQKPIAREYKSRFSVKIGNQIKVIPIESVECFYSENKGIYLHTFDNRDYLLDTTLEVLETELDAEAFYRVSRKYIVSIKAIQEIQLYSNSRLKVILATFKTDEVIVSRERVNDFKNWIDN